MYNDICPIFTFYYQFNLKFLFRRYEKMIINLDCIRTPEKQGKYANPFGMAMDNVLT